MPLIPTDHSSFALLHYININMKYLFYSHISRAMDSFSSIQLGHISDGTLQFIQVLHNIHTV